AVVPGFEKLAQIDRTKEEFQITDRTLHEPRFPTADGRAVLHLHDLPELLGGDDVPGGTAGLSSSADRPHDTGGQATRGTLRLMTVRSEGQFNTVVYEE